MMDRTDRHFRALMHTIAPWLRLYTEMDVAGGPLHRLRREPDERVAAQIAGADPATMADAAAVAVDRGFDEVNINCGCPGASALAGGYGASAMTSPQRVAAIVGAITARVDVDVSIKCRISTHPKRSDAEQDDELLAFVEPTAAAGCRHFIVHARAAHLQGLSTRANRVVPPLRPAAVVRLAAARPDLKVELNGGITTLAQVRAVLADDADPDPTPLAAVMIGRAAYDDPLLVCESAAMRDRTRTVAVDAMARYVDARRRHGVTAWAVARHMFGLTRGVAGGKRARVALAALRQAPEADGRALAAAFCSLAPSPTTTAPEARESGTSCPPGA